MPILGAPLDFTKYEARNLRAHILSASPSSPVTGQLYYNSTDNTLWYWNGSAWISASGGTPPDATAASKGIVQLAGDLAGTAASPQIAAGVITDAEVAAANKDGIAGLASLRTLGVSATQAAPGNHSLDQHVAPASNVTLNGKKIVSLADPTSATDAATKNYVDAVAQGLDAKDSVKAASTGNLVLSGTQTVDGIALVTGDRVLAKDQTTPSQNGIYNVQVGGWNRAADADVWTELVGAYTWVEQGTANADTGWVATVDQGGTLNSTSVTWAQFSGAGQITAGAGLTKAGSTLDVGAGAGITVNADSIQVANDGITNAMIADSAINLASADVTGTLPLAKGGTAATTAPAARTSLAASGYYSSAVHGAGTTITITQATHGLRASRGLVVQVQDEATGNVVLPDVSVAATGDVTVTFGAAVAANAYRVTVVG